jgi:hypothetical protein
MIIDGGMPKPGYLNLDIGGVDSYDQDQSKTSKSLGSMVVLRQHHFIPGVEQMQPVLLIRCRPKRKEIFYEMCRRAAIFYNLIGNVLVDVAKPMVIQWFQDHSSTHFLARRPKKFESEKSEQTHEFGVSLNTFSRPRMIGVLQTYYIQHTGKVWFPQMLNEALDFDETEKDSDNDTVDALGIALMRQIDLMGTAINMEEANRNNP